MSKFDPNMALPLFQIISPRETEMEPEKEINQKHRRRNKKPEAQVHKSRGVAKDDIKIHKTFGANFNKSKHKSYEPDSDREEPIVENTDAHKSKVKRKYLMKENERLLLDVTNLNEQLTSVNHSLNKKDLQVTKLREKLSSVQNFNNDILNENNIIKMQYEDLLVEIEKLKTEKNNCENCEKLTNTLKNNNNEFDLLQTQNKNLKEDLNMLKNVVYRLNVQLERYQDKLRKNNIKYSPSHIKPQTIETLDENQIISQNGQSENHNEHLHMPISWGKVNSHTLGPLLDAYQDTVKEKEDIIQKYEIELSAFTSKLKVIVEENQVLHKKYIDDSENLKKTTDELQKLKMDLKNTKEQNEILVKKCALKHDKVQELCRIYDHKIVSMRRDYEILQEQYHKAKAELSSLQAKNQVLIESNDAMKNDRQAQIPLTVHTASVSECKKLFEELKLQYEVEKTKLLSQIKQLEQRVPDLEKQLVDIGTEKRELQIKIKTTEKQLKKLEQKLSEVQSSLTHTQISRDSCKRQLAKAIEFGKELVYEQESLLKQLSDRSKESKAAVKYGNTMVNKMGSLKMQLKSVQKDAFDNLATVEQRINEQDWSIESMRKDHEKEIASLTQELQDKDAYIARLIEQNAPAQPYLVFRDRHVQFS